MERIIINNFFNDVIFKQVEYKDGYVIYAAELSSRFSNGTKNYALALVPEHLGILKEAFLDELFWVNVQTRNMKQRYNGYAPIKGIWKPSMKQGENIMFDLIGRSQENNTFVARGFPKLKMELLCDPKKKSIYQYNLTINLLAALLTYKCSLIYEPDNIPFEPRVKISRAPPLYSYSPNDLTAKGCIGDECHIQNKYVGNNELLEEFPTAMGSTEYQMIPTDYTNLLLPSASSLQKNKDATNFSSGVSMRYKDDLIKGKNMFNKNHIFQTKEQLQRNDIIDESGDIRGGSVIPLPNFSLQPDQVIQPKRYYNNRGLKLSEEDMLRSKKRF